MFLLDPREPISTWTHATGALLALPATLWLCHLAGRNWPRRLSFAVFGASLAICYSASALFHGMRVPEDVQNLLSTRDRVAIFGLIAGTYTPILSAVFRGWRRTLSLSAVWGYAAFGGALHLLQGVPRPWVNTSLYLGMCWGALLCYVELERRLSRRAMAPLILGGVLYSVGAVINVLNWPEPIPQVFGAHELFHVLVLAGSACHVAFMAWAIAGHGVPREAGVLTQIGSGPILEPHVWASVKRHSNVDAETDDASR